MLARLCRGSEVLSIDIQDDVATLLVKYVHNLELRMESIGVKELRDNLSRILKKVEEGNIIRVLRHGKDVVELRPIRKSEEEELLDHLRDKDLLEGGSGKIGLVRTVKNKIPETQISDYIVEDRR